MLVKFRLSMTVVFSSVMAYLIASAGPVNWLALVILAGGGFLVTGAANTLNQVLEKDYDRLMQRTANRPLAAGRMKVSEAVMSAGLMSLFGITLLAGMQAIPQELYEAAEMDGASVWQRFRFVTLPSLRTVILVVTILSVIWTFNDFSIVWLLTGGGPGHATDVFATYTYKLGFITSRLGYGQTVSVILAPVLIVIIMILSPLMLRGESE